MSTLDLYSCDNKGADQLCSICTADQRLCFHYSASTIPLLLIDRYLRAHNMYDYTCIEMKNVHNATLLMFYRTWNDSEITD